MGKTDGHRAFVPVRIAVLSISDRPDPANDKSGNLLSRLITESGHRVVDRKLCPEEIDRIRDILAGWRDDDGIDAVISTGSTGVTSRDVAPEAHRTVYEQEIPGFGEYFRYMSIKSVGTSMLQSRATAGVAKGTWFFAVPGSSGGIRDVWRHVLVHQLDSRHRPCNLAERMPGPAAG